MIRLKNRQQIESLRRSGAILSDTFTHIEKDIKPGVSLAEIDRAAGEYIRSRGAIPSFYHYDNGEALFPGNLCLSVNEIVIHGIPDAYRLKEGDILGVDVGVTYEGMVTDSAYTFAVGEVADEIKQLCRVTEESLSLAIKALASGRRLKESARAITGFVKPYGYGIVHQFCGHGVGFEVHEAPSIVNLFPSPGPNPRLRPGMVLAIEPMICLGSGDVDVMEDHYTVKCKDRLPAAHFEKTIVIHKDHTEVLTPWTHRGNRF